MSSEIRPSAAGVIVTEPSQGNLLPRWITGMKRPLADRTPKENGRLSRGRAGMRTKPLGSVFLIVGVFAQIEARLPRSEERRVGKEWRCGGLAECEKKKEY